MADHRLRELERSFATQGDLGSYVALEIERARTAPTGSQPLRDKNPEWDKFTDWAHVFGEAERVSSNQVGSVGDCPIAGVLRDQVAHVSALAEGENDGADWVCLVMLMGGRWAFVSAGCDYTGWGWGDGGLTVVSYTLESLIPYIPLEARDRLGVPRMAHEAEGGEAWA